jgi:hypothetical protein
MSKKNSLESELSFVLLFAAAGAFAHTIPLAELLGTDGNFTGFDLMTPLPTAFIGLSSGLLAILISKAVAVLYLGLPIDLMTALRLIPPLGAGVFFYMYNNSRFSISTSKIAMMLIPTIAIVAFWFHPAILGTFAMIYPIYWLIPITLANISQKNIVFRALGATFIQHCIGSVLFLYTIPALANPAIWLSLIPIVAMERGFFALGIALSYLGIKYVFTLAGMVNKIDTEHKFPHLHKNKKDEDD